MTRGAYFECFAGASGDMILGALVDAGWPESDLRASLEAMHLSGWRLEVSITKRGALRATHVRLTVSEPQPERDVRDIVPMIEASSLHASVKARAIALFRELADVEGIQHGQPPESVHFHEVGAVDSILDIVGACAGLHALGIERLYVSPINVGGGVVPTRDGILPVPGPAALELLRRKGAPIYASEYGPEFLTPTGALVLATLADGFGPFPRMQVERIGYGAGQKEFTIPNVLRVSIGEIDRGWEARNIARVPRRRPSPSATGEHEHDDSGSSVPDTHSHGVAQNHREWRHAHDHEGEHSDPLAAQDMAASPRSRTGLQEDDVVEICTNIDDMNPEVYGYLSERLLAGGALDVTLTPVYMKKGRPGTLVTVLTHEAGVDGAVATILDETTTLGVRFSYLQRLMLPRRVETVETRFGRVRVKVAELWGEDRNTAPEFDDCRQAALRHGVPVRAVYDAARESLAARR